MTLFELCPHPGHSPQRANDHVSFLDKLIRSKQLTFIDAADPEVSTFAPKAVPVVQDRRMYDPPEKCSCPRSPLDDPVAHPLLPSWASVPPWEPSWSPAEVGKEECRRLCWSALSIISCQSVTSSAFDNDPPDFFLSNPANVSCPFPKQDHPDHCCSTPSCFPARSLHALTLRTTLLFHRKNLCGRCIAEACCCGTAVSDKRVKVSAIKRRRSSQLRPGENL